MQMDIVKKPMRKLSPQTRERICNCPTPCKYYVHLDEYGRYCENAALDIAYDIFSVVKDLKRPRNSRTYSVWTFEEEQFIRDWYDNKEVRYGDRRVIAEMLDRKYAAVSAKIDNMKERGKL